MLNRLTVGVDATELRGDIQRIARGEITLPTVSAITLIFDGRRETRIAWIDEDGNVWMGKTPA